MKNRLRYGCGDELEEAHEYTLVGNQYRSILIDIAVMDGNSTTNQLQGVRIEIESDEREGWR